MIDTDNKLQEAAAGKIRALLNKTAENGATEAEAIAAAAKARELMDRYRLSMSDVEIQAEPIETVDLRRGKAKAVAPTDYCMKGIEAYCGVKMWYHTDRQTGYRRARILGLKSDAEMARYLYEMIRGAIETETKSFHKTEIWLENHNRRSATSGFQVGMASRINARLHEMARALDPVAKTATGTSLVVVKGAVVKQAFDALGLKFKGHLGGMSTGSGGAYAAGRAAGDRVNLSRPVSSGNTRRIGG
jgi:hypothetical protein